ncbi:MAG: molecular chaperone TorD family protein [Thiohalocapsa sp.]|jgi:TorA maturation chaperone TorD|uniref:TorD/DmsD family molecular chaperone n=1 Tax=Thiohalocapsa sp. TaxID=2497641 RepID=UPI0025CFC649|nr:molecular chaperone TorD family protein [Thiohalocapsa sp.]MCG6940868.1 molecular chaperone TorD family protein [Thiohalocapsa sp.]
MGTGSDTTRLGAGQDAAQLRLLAALLAMPEAESLDALRELVPRALWIAEAVDELAALPLDRWQAEHTRLFVNGYPKTPCIPFESAYRQGQMGGTSAQDLRGLYRKAGLQTEDMPADYLGTELEFAAFLADTRLADAGLAGVGHGGDDCLIEALQAELWREHLAHWLPRFAQDLREHARLLLYRRLGEQLAGLALAPNLPHARED